MSSPDDKKLPTSTLARSFSAQLNDIFLLELDQTLLTKEQEVEQKKLELTKRNAELDALEARLKAAEEKLHTKRLSLINFDSAPTPANTEVGNPLSPNKSPRRRNPIPAFGELSAETEATADGDGDGDRDITDESAPEPPKKDDPVAFQAPRALPDYEREIEARWGGRRSSEEEDRGDGGYGGGGIGRKGEYKDIIGVANNAPFFTSTLTNPDVTKHDEIKITSFLEKELPKLGDEQGEPEPAAEPHYAQDTAAAQQEPTFPMAVQNDDPYGNRTLDPQNTETDHNAFASAAINGQAPITVKPDEDGDEGMTTGDLIDQYDYDSEREETATGEQSAEHQNGIINTNLGFNYATHPTISNPDVLNSEVSAGYRPDRSEDSARTEASPVRSSSTNDTISNTQESTNTKYLVNDLSFAGNLPRRAPTITKSELPPLPGQTPDIPKRKPVKGPDEALKPEMPAATQLDKTDRPPTPPSKALRGINTIPLQTEYNNSNLSIASNSTDNRYSPSVAPTESNFTEKPLPSTLHANGNLDTPTRDSIPERGFGGLLKMKKSLQGLRKRTQTASPVSPSDQQRSFSTGSFPTSDTRPKDEPPLPLIPPEKIASGMGANTMSVQYRASPPPQQAAPYPAQSDVFDRIQATMPNQQPEEPSPRKFEAKHKKAVEAIAKFSGKMSALRALRKKENKEEAPPPPPPPQLKPPPQEPPLAAWELEQRRSQLQSSGYNTNSPQTGYSNNDPQTTYSGASQTWNSRSDGYYMNGSMNSQPPISQPTGLPRDNIPPPPPTKLAEEAPPPIPAKSDTSLPKRVESLTAAPPPPPEKSESTPSTPERPLTGVDRPPRTTSTKQFGLSIFPSASTSRPVVVKDSDSSSSRPGSKEAKEPELPPPPPEKSELFKPFTLQLSPSANNLAVDKPQPSPGLAPPMSPGFIPGRNGRTETYSFLGDYYFGEDQGDDRPQTTESTDYATAAARPPSPPTAADSKIAPSTSKRESDDKINYRIKSFAPFSLGDFSTGFSFDSFQPGTTSREENKAPPVPSMPDLKTLPKPTSLASSSAYTPKALPSLSTTQPIIPPKAERRSPVPQEPVQDRTQSEKSLPEAPKTLQRVPSKPELRDKYSTPLQTVAHRSILNTTVTPGRQSVGSPPLPMKDIPEEGPYLPAKLSPLSSERPPNSATSSTSSVTPISKTGYASSGVSSVRSSGYTESPSATSSTPRTSLSSGVNGPTNAAASTPRIPSGEHVVYPARNSSQGYQQRPPSQETVLGHKEYRRVCPKVCHKVYHKVCLPAEECLDLLDLLDLPDPVVPLDLVALPVLMVLPTVCQVKCVADLAFDHHLGVQWALAINPDPLLQHSVSSQCVRVVHRHHVLHLQHSPKDVGLHHSAVRRRHFLKDADPLHHVPRHQHFRNDGDLPHRAAPHQLLACEEILEWDLHDLDHRPTPTKGNAQIRWRY
ncbi:hypothetical protein ABW20_dc0100481 [Dactylellina cionopaga]|nr:hypothetical protein ABW20_dc0100481 [Dactylellina cionopaga]